MTEKLFDLETLSYSDKELSLLLPKRYQFVKDIVSVSLVFTNREWWIVITNNCEETYELEYSLDKDKALGYVSELQDIMEKTNHG